MLTHRYANVAWSETADVDVGLHGFRSAPPILVLCFRGGCPSWDDFPGRPDAVPILGVEARGVDEAPVFPFLNARNRTVSLARPGRQPAFTR